MYITVTCASTLRVQVPPTMAPGHSTPRFVDSRAATHYRLAVLTIIELTNTGILNQGIRRENTV